MNMNSSGAQSPVGKTIAIDGPAGSGKSTTARLLASRLGYQYLDTGAMYRAVTVVAMRKNISPSDDAGLAKIAENLDISFEAKDDDNQVFVSGENITLDIRAPAVTAMVSEVSSHPGVRRALVSVQKEIGNCGGVVAEGRDTTTVVFPNADLKIYLQASVNKRAERRLQDLVKIGVDSSQQEQVADLNRRDSYDSGRKHSPLAIAPDAHIVDTSNCTIMEQVEKIVKLLESV